MKGEKMDAMMIIFLGRKGKEIADSVQRLSGVETVNIGKGQLVVTRPVLLEGLLLGDKVDLSMIKPTRREGVGTTQETEPARCSRWALIK
jgi:hypothetical protein